MSSGVRSLVCLGATPFNEIAEVVRDINAVERRYHVEAILDDDTSLHGKEIEGVRVVGPLMQARAFPNASFIFGIASFQARLLRYQLVQQLDIPRERFETLIHPTAKIYSTARVGFGGIIHAGVVILNQSVLDDFVVVFPNTVIGPSNRVAEGVIIGPSVTITTHTLIGAYAHLGAACSVGDHATVGTGAQVGMGSLVLGKVAPGVFCLGLPPRTLRRNAVPPELIKNFELLNQGRTRKLSRG